MGHFERDLGDVVGGARAAEFLCVLLQAFQAFGVGE
jgi:hypothetical protein